MAFKFVILAACLAVANAGLIGNQLAYGASPYGYAGAHLGSPLAYAAPVAQYAAPLSYAAPVVTKTIAAPVAVTKTVVDTEYDPHPQYSYSYDVQDALTGDSKSQHETRNGDAVQGSYSFNEADGTRRTVDYTADDVNGFNAVVRKEPLVAKVAAPVAYTAAPAYAHAPLVAKTVVAAPAVSYAAAPALSYAHAPVVARSYAAPALAYSHAAPVAYTAGVARVAAPLSYAAPAAYAAPGYYGNYGYAAPQLSYAAPLAKAYYH